MNTNTVVVAGVSAFILLCAACIGLHLKPIMGKMRTNASATENPTPLHQPLAPATLQETMDRIIAPPGACFGPSTAGLTMEGRLRLDAVFSLLLRNADMRVEVRGFPDRPKGRPSDLGRKRAEAVRAYLVFHGISEHRIRSAGATVADGDPVPECRFTLTVHSLPGE